MGPLTGILQVYSYNLPRRKMRRHIQTRTLPAGFVTSRLHFLRPDKMSALFGKCLSLRNFVLRLAPVPINDPVCNLKSVGLLSGKRE